MTEPKKPQEMRTFEWKVVGTPPEIYGNYIHVGWSLDDFRINVGILKAENVNSKNYFSELQGSLTLPWRQAKNLRDILIKVVADYEEKNGEITTPHLPDPDNRIQGKP